ncbi:MAG: SDR family oxidoreductase [candidate division WOR-3 bacterium]|nr:SDR family oxidoreductase [candidate division WOR-3 bacterium]
MKVLITGASGFLGSFLCERFLSEEYEVIGIDNFITSHIKNVSHLLENKNFKFIELDVCDLDINILRDTKVDIILHFASPASPVDYYKYKIETMLVNSVGTKRLLDIALKYNSRFVLASTSEIYGDPLVHPQDENYWGNVNPIGPRSVYDEAKRFAEALSMAYYRTYNLDIRIIRIFNTYGPRMRINDGRVVSNFIVQALKGQRLTVYGDGNQTRSFCYVDDLIEGIYRFSTYENLKGEVINLGNPIEFKVIELANLVMEFIPSARGVEFLPPLEDDPRQRRPDISKAKLLLNWEPKISIKEGLKLTINYFKKELEL